MDDVRGGRRHHKRKCSSIFPKRDALIISTLVTADLLTTCKCIWIPPHKNAFKIFSTYYYNHKSILDYKESEFILTKCQQIDVIPTNLSKVFDTISHSVFLCKFKPHNILLLSQLFSVFCSQLFILCFLL